MDENNVKFICNAFSLQMVKHDNYKVHVEPCSASNFEKMKEFLPSAVGHEDTARVLGVKCNRINISLEKGDVILVAQLQGGRLPEGSTTLPKGFNFKFLFVTIE